MMYVLLVVYSCISALGLVLFKLGANAENSFGVESFFLQLNMNLFMIFGVLAYVVSFLLYLFLVSRFNLAFLYPLGAGIIYILILAATVFVFGQQLNPMSVIGGVLIIAGILLVNLSGLGI